MTSRTAHPALIHRWRAGWPRPWVVPGRAAVPVSLGAFRQGGPTMGGPTSSVASIRARAILSMRITAFTNLGRSSPRLPSALRGQGDRGGLQGRFTSLGVEGEPGAEGGQSVQSMSSALPDGPLRWAWIPGSAAPGRPKVPNAMLLLRGGGRRRGPVRRVNPATPRGRGPAIPRLPDRRSLRVGGALPGAGEGQTSRSVASGRRGDAQERLGPSRAGLRTPPAAARRSRARPRPARRGGARAWG